MRILIRTSVILVTLGAFVAVGFLAYSHWHGRFRSDDHHAPFRITRVELKRDYANAVLTLKVDYDNREGRSDVTTASADDDPNGARLVTASGRTPQLFFLPGVYPPVIKAGDRADVEIIYWLEKDHLREALYFESKGQRVTVKDGSPFSVESLKNQGIGVFTQPNWSQ